MAFSTFDPLPDDVWYALEVLACVRVDPFFLQQVTKTMIPTISRKVATMPNTIPTIAFRNELEKVLDSVKAFDSVNVFDYVNVFDCVNVFENVFDCVNVFENVSDCVNVSVGIGMHPSIVPVDTFSGPNSAL